MTMQPMPLDRGEAISSMASRVTVSLVVMLIVTSLAVFTFFQIDRELERTKTANSDNRTWVLAQIEVDTQNLEIALRQAMMQPDAANLDELRLVYDILYSRAQLVQRAPTMDQLSLRDTAAWQDLNGSAGLIQRFLPMIDGPDPALQAALPDMLAATTGLRDPLRDVIVEAFAESIAFGDMARQDLQRTLYIFLAALVVSIMGLLLFLATIYRQAGAQRRYAKMLELAVHNLQATIESARDAVLIVNGADQVIGSNKAGEAMLGRVLSAENPVSLGDILAAPADAAPQSGPGDRMECTDANGLRIPVDVSIAATTTATGHAFKIAFLRDMTQQIEHEQKLAKASELARRGEEAKDRFLAVMSHEMRTPLSGLLSATDLIETTTTLDAQQSWLISTVRSCGLAALEQVNNILELTRLAARDTNDYPQSDFHMGAAVEQQVQLYQALALERGNTLIVSVADCCSGMVHAPLPLLRRILNNLLSNAIKFTRDGMIEVRMHGGPAGQAGHCRFHLSVRDSGIGIAEDDLERIFDNFETLDSSYARTQEGTGLGLGIAKLAAEAMGGTLQVESTLGEGTCFTVVFEAAVLPDQGEITKSDEAQVARHNPLKILLAEDNEINCLLLERQLSRLGHSVTTASDGAKAIAAVEKARFDIILMDISMPHVDGLAATQHLRENGYLDGVPVIALTAQAAPNRIKMLRDAGMADVVTKPAPIALLEETMQRLVAKVPHAKASQMPPAKMPLVDVALLGDLVADLGAGVLQDMAARFSLDMKATHKALTGALQDGNLETLSQVAHRSAGAAAVLTMCALAAELRAVENAAAEGSIEGLEGRCKKISLLSDQSLDALQTRLAAA